jgi:tRNA (cytidine32/uridine32-2'-O)-methyltransferase
MFEQIRIVLVNPSHPGNIGAVARAMKNMGLTRLFLVAPEAFPHPEATWRAVGADDVLNQAIVTADLPQALTGCEYVYAASARSRRLEWPGGDARQCAEQIAQQHSGQEVALVFGRESSGLTNEEFAHCHYHVYIPANEAFSSLNLAAAVQILAYELRMALLAHNANAPKVPRQLAPNEQVQGFFDHLENTLVQIDFLNPSHPKRLMQRLQRLFNRSQMDETEVNILRGILTAVNKVAEEAQ